MVNSISKTGLLGIQRGLEQVAQSAAQISSGFTEDGQDPTESLISLKQGEFQVKASSKVVKVGDELERAVLDILA